MNYKIVRYYSDKVHPRTIKRGLTLEQAQAHCREPRTSSTTEPRRSRTTRQHPQGWFDAYVIEGPYDDRC